MRSTRRPSVTVVVTLVTAVLPSLALPVSGQSWTPAHEGSPVHIEGLGSLAFPNSGAAAAQHDFLSGVLLLHSFEYARAAEAFRRAQELDPGFALAYWGEAMTHNHPVWNEKDVAAAREILARYAPTPEARAVRAPTDRERGYMEAIDVLFADGEKARLDTLYAERMETLSAAHPDDLEAATFHALAILGLSQGDRDVPRYMEAGAVALDAFERNPGHPGAAHYVIHAFDDPTHAVLAMDAARAYSVIAPNAGHAQHMTSHIFLARGMWHDMVTANINADAVVDRLRAENGLPPTGCGHYNEWLGYGFTQQTRKDDAQAHVLACIDQASGMPEGAAFSAVVQRNWYLSDWEDWSSPIADVTARENPVFDALRAPWLWGDVLVAVGRGEVEQATGLVEALEAAIADVGDGWVSPYAPVWVGTAQAIVFQAEGRIDDAIATARRAADHEASLPIDFGPPIAFRPAREVEADLLRAAGRHDEAMAAYRAQLARTPDRLRTLAGLAESAMAVEAHAIAIDAGRRMRSHMVRAPGEPMNRYRERILWLEGFAAGIGR